MIIRFFKYQGAGNDFIMIDNRTAIFDKNQINLIEQLCDRRFGIGADGLILLEASEEYDFEMVYMNADGRESSMCGNGGRCIVAFAHYLNIIKSENTVFKAIDGIHHAQLKPDHDIRLEMSNVINVERNQNDFYLNTGSPHYVIFVTDIDRIDVVKKGREIRYSDRFEAQGTNVNFVEIIDHDHIKVRTYERGVEGETLSCGTGVTAAAIATHIKLNQETNQYFISTPGGPLQVSFNVNRESNSFEKIYLCGPASQVFDGEIDITQFNKIEANL